MSTNYFNCSALRSLIITLLALGLCVLLSAGLSIEEVHAEDVTYTHNATPVEGLPGVYKTTVSVGDKKDGETPSTIGIPSIAKQNLTTPTKEMPAIIMGAAVNYEMKTGPTEFTPIEGAELVAPYSYFRWGVMDEQIKEPDGTTTTHKKLSGFDGSYYIVRVDLTDLLKDVQNPEGKYLHVRQDDNKALMVAVGFDRTTYSNGGSKTGSYSLANNLAALKDTTGNYKDKPYFDVIILSSDKLAAGADQGKENAPSADIKLSFYVDGVEDYHPELKALDPNNMPTFPYKPEGSTVEYQDELTYNQALLTKYYDEEVAASTTGNTIESQSSHIVKGSDLEIDVAIDENHEESSGDETTKFPVNWQKANADFWSMTSAIDYQPIDDHTILLICEVPVLEGMSIEGTPDNTRSVILDVNSFDIQIANNTTQKEAGLTIDGQAKLTIKDGTNTSGAELAIGNNASMVIKKDGILEIDESCTSEVEYDAGTTTTQDGNKDLFNGEITIEDGGKVINHGVINIEGTEGKPMDPNQQEQTEGQQRYTDMKTADIFVNAGGILENHGCISLKGILYIMGRLDNDGKFSDSIVAQDPDKGTTSYHKGIQVTWKDDVTREGVVPGVLNVGIDDKGNIDKNAVLNNSGDIVLCPGTFNLYGTLNQNVVKDKPGHVYLCTAYEAIIPITPDPNDPLTVEKRITLEKPERSVFNNNGNLDGDETTIRPGQVELLHNGVLGNLTDLWYIVKDMNGSQKEIEKKLEDTEKKLVAAQKSSAENEKKVQNLEAQIIKAKKPANLKVKAKKKGKATVTFRSLGKGYTYEIRRSKNKSKGFSIVTSSTKTKVKVTGMKKGKTYYYKVRAFKTVGKSKVYTGFSKVIKVKAK